MSSASMDISQNLLIGHYAGKPMSILKVIPEMFYYKPSEFELSDVVRRNPMWNMAHLIAHFGYADCFNNKTIQSLANIPCGKSLMTPLHVAIKSQQFESVQQLMDLGACLQTVDASGDNAFHFAANSSKHIIKTLVGGTAVVDGAINAYNFKGQAPLHLACEAGKTDCVRELIKAGAIVNLGDIYNDSIAKDIPQDHLPSLCMAALLGTFTRQMSFSDTVRNETTLHWSKSLELMEILVDNCKDIDAKNERGDSALHIMVKLNRLSCAVLLLSHQADVNIQDSEGNTSLHRAVITSDLSMVQTIISFGADVNILNNQGETARHLAATKKNSEILFALHVVEAARCFDGMINCSEGCSFGGKFDGTPPKDCAISKKTETLFQEILQSTNFKSSTQKSSPCKCSSSGCSTQESRVLCLDGGGIRGLVLIQMLDELERVFGKPIAECFDLISGTSTGGILALALATGKTVKECRCLYFRMKDKVFVGVRPYDADLFAKFLQKELGISKTMADIEKPKIMITATRKDRQPAELHIFRNYTSPVMLLNHLEMDTLNNEPLPHPAEQLLWEVARATSSAPTYFRAHGPYIDGGLISNNPTLDTLTEIHQCNQACQATGQSDKTCRIKVLISLGTGRVPIVPVHSVDEPDSASDFLSKGFFNTVCRLTKEVANMGELVIDQVTQPDGRVTARALAICDMLQIPYLRLNPQLTENVALDETNAKTLAKMLWETTAYMRSMRKELEEIKHLLVS